MTEDPRAPTVAIVNTTEDVVELLAEVFWDEGFHTITAYVREFKRGDLDFDFFLAEHRPDVVLYDIALPYEENWAYFQELRAHLSARAVPVVLMTTNKPALDRLVGPTAALELVGKPFDIGDIVAAVRRAAAVG